jgi:hypothetical protein
MRRFWGWLSRANHKSLFDAEKHAEEREKNTRRIISFLHFPNCAAWEGRMESLSQDLHWVYVRGLMKLVLKKDIALASA